MTTALKRDVIIGAYLAVESMNLPPAEEDDVIAWGEDSANDTVILRALFSGVQLSLTHRFKPASDDDHRNYATITQRQLFVQGEKVGRQERRVPRSGNHSPRSMTA